jgi:hypothetical protein
MIDVHTLQHKAAVLDKLIANLQAETQRVSASASNPVSLARLDVALDILDTLEEALDNFTYTPFIVAN